MKNIVKSLTAEHFLKFDGSNDFLINDASTPFTQWERTQPWTFFAKFMMPSATQSALYSSMVAVNAGITIWGRLSITGRPTVEMAATSSVRTFAQPSGFAFVAGTVYTLQLTYNGNSSFTGFSWRINDIPYTSQNTVSNNLSGTIINPQNSFQVGKRYLNDSSMNGWIQEVSFVNYVKSVAEMQADFAAGTQSQGTGNYLLRQIPKLNPISLNSLQYFDGGYLMNINGKSLPLSLATDFTLSSVNSLVKTNKESENRILARTKGLSSSLFFNGVSSRVDIIATSFPRFLTNDFEFSFNIKTNNQTNGVIFCQNNSNFSQSSLLILFVSNSLQLWIQNQNSNVWTIIQTPVNTLLNNVPYFVRVTRVGNLFSIIVNENLIVSATHNFSIQSTNIPYKIGASGTNIRWFEGTICNFKMSIANNLILDIPFDEGSGTTASGYPITNGTWVQNSCGI
jgi:hypothetical protein